MAHYLGSRSLGLALAAAAMCSFVACGGDSDGDGGGGGAGDTGSGGSGNTGGGSSSGTGWPSALPESTAECEGGRGSDGCYFDGCCAELVACAANEDCETLYGCYLGCEGDASDCFVNCGSAAFEAGAEDFGTALGCLATLSPSCAPPGGTGGTGGTGGNGEGGNGGAGTLGSARDALGWDLNVSDDPLVAELELDSDLAVSELVTVEGGTITATAADGTTFELTLPAGAVYGPTLITLTPLASLAVPPLEGPAYGVQIEPDGLELMGSPALRITPPDGEAWPVDRQIPLSISGGDQSVSLALIEPGSEELELVLTHFSSYGTLLSEKGLGATLSEGDIRSRFAGDVEDRLQSAAAERLGKERVKELLGVGEGSEAIDSLVADLFPEYEKHVVAPRVAKAGESCAAGKLALQTVLGFERQKQLLGVSEGNTAFLDLLPIVGDVCTKEEYELCRDHHIITRVLPVLLSLSRQAQLLGLGTEIDGVYIPPSWVLQAEEYARSCLKFELQFDSDVAYADESPGISMTESVTARVPLNLTASFTTLPIDALPPGAQEVGALISGGPASVESSSYAVHTDERCRTIDDEEAADGELYVSFMGFVPGIPTEETPGGSPEVLDFGLSLALSPNLSKYVFSQQREEESGCGEVTATGEEVLSWSSTVGSSLFEMHSTNENGAWFEDWDIQPDGGHILAVKDLSINDSTGSNSIRGPVNMILIHTPDP